MTSSRDGPELGREGCVDVGIGTPSRLLEWSSEIGEFTRRMVETMLTTRPHREAGYRAAMGLRPLAGQYGAERLEAALHPCARWLATRLDQQPLSPPAPAPEPVAHDNVRGAAYYGAAAAEVSE